MRVQEDIGRRTKYMIHATPKRMWYVEEYLVPSMINQGIGKDDIVIYNDDKGLGNLNAFIDSVKGLKHDIWHLQDDIIISSDFKEQTTKHDTGIVCGFCSRYSSEKPCGIVIPDDMWYSFPCIRIPIKVSDAFVEWINKNVKEKKNEKVFNWIIANKYDDSLFMEFLEEEYPLMAILNLNPNIVNHIDYLIGGGIVNPNRREKADSIHWREPELVAMLEASLKRRNI